MVYISSDVLATRTLKCSFVFVLIHREREETQEVMAKMDHLGKRLSNFIIFVLMSKSPPKVSI